MKYSLIIVDDLLGVIHKQAGMEYTPTPIPEYTSETQPYKTAELPTNNSTAAVENAPPSTVAASPTKRHDPGLPSGGDTARRPGSRRVTVRTPGQIMNSMPPPIPLRILVIDDNRAIHEQLRKSEEHFRLIAENVADLIAIVLHKSSEFTTSKPKNNARIWFRGSH